MLKVDLHTHSIVSGHALNTVYEMVREAKGKGMGLIGIVEHGPSMEGAPHEGYFWVSDQLNELYGVRVLLGVEASVLNERGDIDLGRDILTKQRVVIAGLHSRTPYRTNNIESNTLSLVNAMQNPFIQIISHPYRIDFPINVERVFDAAVETNTLLELNNQAFTQHASNECFLDAYRTLVALARKHGYPLIAGSDAHVATKIGEDSGIIAVQEKIGLTEDMLINNYLDDLLKWKKKR